MTTVAALGLALYYAWDLALVTLAVVPISALVLGWISSRMQPTIKAQMDELTQASKLANNSISSIDSVKYFNGQDFEMWQYARTIRKAASFYLIQARANAFQIGFVRFVTSIMFVQGFWYGSHLIDVGKRDPGQISDSILGLPDGDTDCRTDTATNARSRKGESFSSHTSSNVDPDEQRAQDHKDDRSCRP